HNTPTSPPPTHIPYTTLFRSPQRYTTGDGICVVHDDRDLKDPRCPECGKCGIAARREYCVRIQMIQLQDRLDDAPCSRKKAQEIDRKSTRLNSVTFRSRMPSS